MTLPLASYDPAFRIYLALAQYPILRPYLRERMRQELFERGMITFQEFEAQVRQYAIRSQSLEGLSDPFGEEPGDVWETRLDRVRSHLTDFYFGNNLPYALFEQIVRAILDEQGALTEDQMITFNPELAPQEMLFEQAEAIDNLPPEERSGVEARLQEIKVVLIRTIISDQLAYINIAKDWFTLEDLANIRMRKIGRGKIGGKSAGMLLAWRILQEVAENEIRETIRIPESYYIGADVMYTFMAFNGLMHWADQKYKAEDKIREDYPRIEKDYIAGIFPPDILDHLQGLLDSVGDQSIIVRSSSLLEDNFGTSFAGKYHSYFCPNQGTPVENLQAFTEAIARVYASALNPDALMYRRSRGLQDYDERIAALIQVVQGDNFGKYYLPHVAGVAFSRNIFRWTPQIRPQDGFLRLVWGLGTRAVERVGNDYPRLVALSHPSLRPEASPKEILKYSQQYVDLIDLEDNAFKTLPVKETLDFKYPILRYLAQSYKDDFLASIRTGLRTDESEKYVITFDDLLKQTPFAERMRRILNLLEREYNSPVDMEFTAHLKDTKAEHPDIEICILQCRPQSHLQDSSVRLPRDIVQDDVIFSTWRMVPQGFVDGIGYVIFVTSEGYGALPDHAARNELSRAIGRINRGMEGKKFILVGPGRWGTSNPELGVHVGYSDIYRARALIELTGKSLGIGIDPEPSYGTHFFQDLIEAQIYPLAISLEDEDIIFNQEFFFNTPNRLVDMFPNETDLADCIRIIEVSSYRTGWEMHLVMDGEKGKAVAYLVPKETQS